MNFSKICLPLLLASTLTGCAATYEKTAKQGWDMMAAGRGEDAVKLYESDVKNDRDQLLKYMDEGVLLRSAGKFEESNQIFFKAAKILDRNGYLSLGEQAATLLANDRITTYQGEDFEKVLVHLYLGMNYISLKKTDDALVETRRVNEILYKMIYEAKRPYELNAFARYLGAAMFEGDRNWNDAFVAYQNVLKIDPSLSTWSRLQVDLMRIAVRGGFDQQLEEFKKQYGQDRWKEASNSLAQKDASVVLMFEAGKSPEKYSSRESHRQGSGPTAVEVLMPIAHYKKRFTTIQTAVLKLTAAGATTQSTSRVLYSIEKNAISQLDDRMGRAIAKALLTASLKAGVGVAVAKATNSSDLGALVALGLMLASEADTRSWLLLPATLQIARVDVPAGKYNATVDYLDVSGVKVDQESLGEITVRPLETRLIQKRVYK